MADLGGVRVFVTNSHCSSSSWDTDASIFHQPYPSRFSEVNRIGQEYRDRRGESCGFLSPNVCRYADATAVRIDAGITSDRGKIARTLYAGGTTGGSLQIDAASPSFRITSEGTPYQNQFVNKIGARTGWSRGRVTKTCVVTYQGGRSWSKLRCQYFAEADVDDGDSGSPVFSDSGDGSVALFGMVWGKTEPMCDPLSGGGCQLYVNFVFSPISGIEKDLGSLETGVPVPTNPYTPPPPEECVDPTNPWQPVDAC